MDVVELSNVKFFYTNNRLILDDINLSVPYGKIYSLLGPSGAGKTTLLRIILGRIAANSGHVKVMGAKPGTNNRMIGYMPQDQALCKTFTVGQTLQYFANIYRLSKQQFLERKKNLQELLGLPKDSEKISSLSGGQQKIVSLSVTFLQQPKLMILDEPTVGSDPTLGDFIWRYLHRLCQNENISIIVVTHYIEEAGRAHITGIMRDGKMLEQASPNLLIEKYQQKTLEDVFLYLCMNTPNQSNTMKTMVMERTSNDNRIINDMINLNDDRQQSNWSTRFSNLSLDIWITFVLIHRNLARFIQFNISLLVFLIPAFQATILGLLFGVESVAIPIAVYDQESLNPYYSTKLLDSIKKIDIYYLKPVPYDSLDSAIGALKEAKVYGAMQFGSNFTDSLLTRVVDPESLDNNTLIGSNIKLYLDTTNYLLTNGLVDSLRQTVYDFLGQVYLEQNLTRFEAPIDVREVIYAENSRLSDFLLPGYLISFIYLSQVTLSSQLLIQERREGLFERSLVAGVSHNLVLLSHFFSSIILAIVQIILMLFVALKVFQIVNYGSIWLVFILVLAQALSAIATGLLTSSLVNEGSSAILIAIFITFSQIFSSGSIFPKEYAPEYVRRFISLSPISIPSESLRNVMLRAWDIWHPRVYDGLMLNLVSTLALTMITAIAFKRYS